MSDDDDDTVDIENELSSISINEQNEMENKDDSTVDKSNSSEESSDIVIPIVPIENDNGEKKSFRSLMRRSMPKIRSIVKFKTLHENVQAEVTSQVDSISEKSNITKPPLPRKSAIKKTLKKSKSLASIKSNNSSMSTRNELVRSFVNSTAPSQRGSRASSATIGYQEYKKSSQKKTRQVKSAKMCRKKTEYWTQDPVYINTKVQGAWANPRNQCHCIQLHNNNNNNSSSSRRFSNDFDNTVNCGNAQLHECYLIFQRFEARGVRVSLETIKRGILPPSDTRREIYEMDHNRLPDHNGINGSSGLLSHPSTWLPKEYQRLRSARKRMDEWTEETIKRSTVVTSDDEADTSTNSSTQEKFRKSVNRVSSVYHSFARNSNTNSTTNFSKQLTSSRSGSKFITGTSNLNDSQSQYTNGGMTRRMTVYRKRVNRRPSTAVL